MDRNPDTNLPGEEESDGEWISRNLWERETGNYLPVKFDWLGNENPSRVSSFSALFPVVRFTACLDTKRSTSLNWFDYSDLPKKII